jgi:adenylate cyclase
MTQALHAAELATATGTSAETIGRLVDAGVLDASGDGFRPGDVGRVRLVLALEASGVPLEAVGGAMRTGALSLDFVDLLMPEPRPLLARRHAEVTEELGLPPELTHRIRSILGTATASDDEPIRKDDEELARMMAEARRLGAGDNDLTRVVLVFVEAIRRLVEAQRDFIDEVVIQPYLAGGGSPAGILEATSDVRMQFRHIARRLILLLNDRLIEEAVFQNVVVLAEAALAAQGIGREPASPEPAIVFVDQTGYTSMTEESGDLEAAQTAARFYEVTQVVAGMHGGRLVKILGDGVMLHFPDATSAVRSTLAVRARVAQEALPPIHAGVNVGPVLRRDGDYFGSVVNVSSRLADYAGPAEVLVTREVVDAWNGGADVAFDDLGPASLKNVPRPVDVFRASPRNGDSA